MSGYWIKYETEGPATLDAIEGFAPAGWALEGWLRTAVRQYGGERELAEANLAAFSERNGGPMTLVDRDGNVLATAEGGLLIRKENEARLVSSRDMEETPDPTVGEVRTETRTPDQLRREAYRLMKLADRLEWAERGEAAPPCMGGCGRPDDHGGECQR